MLQVNGISSENLKLQRNLFNPFFDARQSHLSPWLVASDWVLEELGCFSGWVHLLPALRSHPANGKQSWPSSTVWKCFEGKSEYLKVFLSILEKKG